MLEADRTKETERLANEVAGLIEGRASELHDSALEISATALTMTLASVIAAYPPLDRATAEQKVVDGLHARVCELERAGLSAASPKH